VNKNVNIRNAPSNKPHINYSYVVLTASFFIMAIVYGAQFSFGVFFKPILTDFGWSRAETAGAVALGMIVSGLLSIVSGRVSDKFGPKLIVSTGTVIISAGYLLMSSINSLWQLYLYYGVLVAGGSSAIYIPLVSLIARWFTRRRGLMSGIGISGIGFGVGVIPALASQLIVSYDWHTALVVVGIGGLMFILILARFLRNTPEAYPLDSKSETGNSSIANSNEGYSLKESLKNSRLWLIVTAWVLYGFYYQVGFVHIVAYATDRGLSSVVAATVLTIIGVIGGFGRIGMGFLGDRLGIRKTILYGFLLTGLGYICLSASHSIWMLYVFAVVFGALNGVGLLLIPIIAEYFGFKDLGVISGIVVFANSAGAAISPPLAGAIFDSTGSYEIAFILCGIFGLAAGILMWLLKPMEKKAARV
jgi:MFS transporter, OFA family, oxalate/formate antiporter